MMPEVGYSGTPLVRKLGIKPGSRIALLGRAGRTRGDARRAAPRTSRSAAGRAAPST